MGSLKEELQAIYLEHGKLTRLIVVETARDPNHPLHNRFDWDDESAAEKYRLVQAGELIRAVKISTANPALSKVNEYVSVARGDGYTYVPLDEVAHDPLLTQMVLHQAEREWRAFLARYQGIKEVIELIRGDIDAVAS